VTKVIKSIEIEASPEEAFAFLLDKEKMNEAAKGFSQFEYTSKGPVGVGTTMHYVTGSGGSTMEFDSEVIEFVENKKLVSHTVGASKFKGTASFTLEPTAKGTKVTYSMDYKMPYSVLGKLIDKVSVHKKMEKGISDALENGKKALEA
jgi:carbon monoxide dehydrogenase subunit G